jgi:hypothetical protein
MDPTTFDDLTKALATSTSRRQALKTIAAATIGGILGLGGIGTALGAPKCHRQGTGCDTTSQCCKGLSCQNGKCAPCTANGGTCSGNTDCCSGNCSNGFCCASGQVGVSNGTCATPCTTCSGGPRCGCGQCECDRNLCETGSANFTGCSDDNGCPAGQFCSGGFCFTAC